MTAATAVQLLAIAPGAAAVQLLAFASGAAAASAAGVAAAGGVAARQAGCPALLDPSCGALQKLLADARADDTRARALAGWVVAIVVIRVLVVVVDEQVARARRWTVQLGAGAASVGVRTAIIAVSSWQLRRLWGNASTLVESRLLAVAVAVDAATCAERSARLIFDGISCRMSRALFAGDPPTYRFCEATKQRLQSSAPSRREPQVLQSELHFLVRDYEVLYAALQGDEIRVFLARPSSLIFAPLALLAALVMAAGALLLWHHVIALGTEFGDNLWIINMPWIARRTCVFGRSDDGAVAASIDDHLYVFIGPGSDDYERPLAFADVGSLTSSGTLDLDMTLRLHLSCGHRRLWALASLLWHAVGTFIPLAQWEADRQELSSCRSSLTGHAPLDRLVIDPAVCTVDRLRLRVLRGCLVSVHVWEGPSWRLGTALLFGLRALAAAPGGRPGGGDGWAPLAHG